MGNGLCPVDEHRNAAGMRDLDDSTDRVHRAERVRHVRDRDDAGTIAEQRLVAVDAQLTLVRHRHNPQPGSALVAQHLPRHDVRVVLHHRDDDLVSRTNANASVGLRHQVDGLGCAPHKDDFLGLGRVQEAGGRFPRFLVGVGGPLAQQVHTPMHVRVLVRVVANQSIEHHLRLLRRRGVVEIDERLAVREGAQDRKVFADAAHVERRPCQRDRRHRCSPGNRRISS